MKNDLAKENNFGFKKQEMDDALSMCWDATVRKIEVDNKSNKEIEKWQQTQSTSKEFWRSYNQKKPMRKKSGMITVKDISLLSGEINQTNTSTTHSLFFLLELL